MTQQNRRPMPGEFYRHFKNKLYQIIAVAIHSETGEEMVVYQALYEDFRIYVRPFSLFVSEVDHVKYPQVTQMFRFELVEMHSSKIINQENPVNEAITACEMTKEEDYNVVEAGLMQFLDANTCKEKLNVLFGIKNHLSETMLNNMMIAMDLPILEGSMEEHFDILKDYLQTRVRFESDRLR